MSGKYLLDTNIIIALLALESFILALSSLDGPRQILHVLKILPPATLFLHAISVHAGNTATSRTSCIKRGILSQMTVKYKKLLFQILRGASDAKHSVLRHAEFIAQTWLSGADTGKPS